MKKILIFLLFLPFVSSAFYVDQLDGYTLISSYLYRFSPSSTNVVSVSVGASDFSVLSSAYKTHSFGLVLNPSGTLYQPSDWSNTNSYTTSRGFLNSVRVKIPSGSNVWITPRSVSSVDSIFNFAANVISSGFTSSGIVLETTFVNRGYYNFDYKVVVGDLASSTNNFYRQLLLQHLSSIQSSIINIDSGVSSLAPEVSNIRSINTAILTNVQNSVASLGSIDEAVDLLVDRVGEVLDKMNSDPYVSDFTNAVLALSEINGSFTPSYVDHLLSSYAGLDSPFAKALFALSVKQQVNSRTSAEEFVKTAAGMPSELVTIGQYLSQDVVDALIGDYSDIPTRGGKVVNTRTSIKAQLRSWREEAKKQLQDWQDDLRQQLKDWKTSDETGYLNVRGCIDNVTSNQYRYFDNNSPDSAVNFGVGNLTNAAERIVRDSSFAVTNSINGLRDFLNDNLFGSDSQGANVRISFPLRYETSREVNVHDVEVADAIRNGYINIQELKSAILEALNTSDPSVRIKGTNHVDLSEWLDEWRRWVDNATFYDLAYSLEDFMTNALPLFSDYQSTYKLSHNFYKSAFDTVRNSSHSNVLSRLCFYGLSSEPVQGNFFDFFTSYALLQSELSSSLLDAKDMIDDLASSSSWFDGLSVFSAARQVSDSIPSRSQIEQIVTTASDGTNLVLSSSTDLLDSFGLMTNLHSHAFSVFKSSSTSLPDHIVLFRFKTSLGDSGSSYRDVSIPVGTVPNLWLVIRLSIAFSICAVNMILFPKFLLKLALLFMPLFKKSLPFLNASA